MVNVKDIAEKNKTLNAEFNKKNPDLKKCGQLLEELKLELTELMFLPVNDNVSKQELLLARDTLEIGARYCIAAKDTAGFERFMAQLKTYYMDYANKLDESASKYELLGLNLLSLLSQNRVAEFHTELELLPPDILRENVYIKKPVALEQYIMEGSYNKILLAKGNVPSPLYNYFIDILLVTIRDEIASCMEKAYERISYTECAKMLNLDVKLMDEYVNQRNWSVGKDKLVHFRPLEKKNFESEVPSHELAQMAITYAKEMEQIV